MLTAICQELKNWFIKSDNDKKIGVFTISDGVIAPFVDLKTNQYYRIIGSVFNDGVHKYGDKNDKLVDETFDGAIWIMYVPGEVISLADEISAYNEKYGEVSPFISESFGGYSYSKTIGSKDTPASWQDMFSGKLSNWRKI